MDRSKECGCEGGDLPFKIRQGTPGLRSDSTKRREQAVMRELTEPEAKTLFEKLSKYIGRNISLLVDRSDEPHVFRVQKDRVYYVSEAIAKRAISIPRDNLISLGVCFGKFTKTGKFTLHVTALDFIAQYSKYKIWLKNTGEMSYVYGNNVLKAHIAKMTEDIPEHQGVVIMSSNDIPLGFAVAAKSSSACAKLDPTAIAAFHQTDLGEYLRDEDTLI